MRVPGRAVTAVTDWWGREAGEQAMATSGGCLLVLSAIALHGAAAFSVGTGSWLRWPALRARACASGRAGNIELRAEADTARKFRGPGNPNAADLQTPTYGTCVCACACD